MPSFRRVSFSGRNDYSRLPHDDELYVMKAFAKHADNCDSCYDPYQVYKDGLTLCPRGHQRALDVAHYVYTRAGQPYSQVDRERNQRVQIEIPANCESVRQLLKAMDRGLRLMRKTPPVSYDKTYYIPARLSVPDNQRSTPASRPSTANPIKRSNSGKGLQLETPIPPPQPRPRSRSRAASTSSASSASSVGSRASRPCFVRPRSRDGKRNHSPIFIRPGISRLNSDTGKEALPVSSHSRNNSSSSSSSRSSSIFSRSSSRNSSVSSQSSRENVPTSKSSRGSSPPVAFKDPEYREPIYQTIAPKESLEVSSPASPVRGSRRHSRR